MIWLKKYDLNISKLLFRTGNVYIFDTDIIDFQNKKSELLDLIKTLSNFQETNGSKQS